MTKSPEMFFTCTFVNIFLVRLLSFTKSTFLLNSMVTGVGISVYAATHADVLTLSE